MVILFNSQYKYKVFIFSVEHGVSCLLTRKGVEQLSLSCPLRIPVGCVDDEDVGSEHPGGQHHQHEGVAQPGASLTGPLALLPVLVQQHIVGQLEVILNYPRHEGAHCGEQSQAVPQIKTWHVADGFDWI